MKVIVCAGLFLVAFGFSASAQDNQARPSTKPVTVEIKNSHGQSVGTAQLSSAAKGVKIVLDVKNFPPGEHSIHIHQVAKCEAPDFKSAGPHFDAMGMDHSDHTMHGATPAGDIPNFSLIVAADGSAHTSVVAPNVTLGTDPHSVFSNGGTSIVIHAATGASSSTPARIACGVITKPE